jgi:hypothetical protein
MITSTVKFVMLAIVIVASVGLMVGPSAFMEQIVKAQNLTGNMTDSAGNMTGTDDASGEISGRERGDRIREQPSRP